MDRKTSSIGKGLLRLQDAAIERLLCTLHLLREYLCDCGRHFPRVSELGVRFVHNKNASRRYLFAVCSIHILYFLLFVLALLASKLISTDP